MVSATWEALEVGAGPEELGEVMQLLSFRSNLSPICVHKRFKTAKSDLSRHRRKSILFPRLKKFRLRRSRHHSRHHGRGYGLHGRRDLRRLRLDLEYAHFQPLKLRERFPKAPSTTAKLEQIFACKLIDKHINEQSSLNCLYLF